jgi:hypothetical protein
MVVVIPGFAVLAVLVAGAVVRRVTGSIHPDTSS